MENYMVFLIILLVVSVGLIAIGVAMSMRKKDDTGPGMAKSSKSKGQRIDEASARLPDPLGEPSAASSPMYTPPAQAAPAVSAAPVSPTPPAPSASGLAEVVRLLRNPQSGEFAVQVDGYIYHHPSQLSSSQQRLLAAGGSLLQKWLAIPPTAVPIPPPTPAAPGASLPVMGAAAGAAAAGAAPITPPAPSRPALAGLKVEPGIQPVKAKPLEAISRTASTPAAAPQFRSIPEQIDEILQQRLRGTPLEGRGIALMLDPVEGVMVKVDSARYPGVDAVPDEEVRSAIKGAVAEWERRPK